MDNCASIYTRMSTRLTHLHNNISKIPKQVRLARPQAKLNKIYVQSSQKETNQHRSSYNIHIIIIQACIKYCGSQNIQYFKPQLKHSNTSIHSLAHNSGSMNVYIAKSLAYTINPGLRSVKPVRQYGLPRVLLQMHLRQNLRASRRRIRLSYVQNRVRRTPLRGVSLHRRGEGSRLRKVWRVSETWGDQHKGGKGQSAS